MTAPRRLLLLAYYFPPTASAGSVRVGALAKYLPRFGFEVTVLTPLVPGSGRDPTRVIETEDGDLGAAIKRRLGLSDRSALKDQVGAGPGGARLRARLIETAKALVLWPDSCGPWIGRAARAGGRALAEGPFAAILSSSPPPSAHRAALRLKRTSGLPWLADLRDLWSDDHNSTAPGWRRRLDREIERRTLGHADALATVSEPLAASLRERYPAHPVHTIRNGFDPELAAPAERLTPDFTLTHTGILAQGRRDPTLLFTAVRNLIDSGAIDRRRIRLRFYSKGEPWVRVPIERLGLGDVVELHPWLTHREALEAQKESQVLLLLHWGGEAERGVYTAKVFEYLAARRPILLLGGGPGVLRDLIAETGAGVHVDRCQDLERRLLDWYRAYLASGSVPYHGDAAVVAGHSHLRMAEDFAAALDRMIGSTAGLASLRGERL